MDTHERLTWNKLNAALPNTSISRNVSDEGLAGTPYRTLTMTPKHRLTE